MKDKNLNPASLIITAVALVLLAILLVYAAHHQEPFVPSHPATTSDIAPITDATASAPTSADTTSQPTSVCYASTSTTAGNTSLEITTSDGHNATGSLTEALPKKTPMNGTLSGTLAGSSDGSSVVFSGQYVDAMSIGNGIPETITLTQNQAQIGSLTLPRVDCTQ